MATAGYDRLGRFVSLLLLALALCAGQLVAGVCDQPVVNFQAGQLTLSSNGCSLQQVLAAVSNKTGIETKMPAAASTVPVFAHLGPADPRQVISALLDGIPFNWSLAIASDGSRSLVAVTVSERSVSSDPIRASLTQGPTTLNGKLPAGRVASGSAKASGSNDAASASDAPLQDQPKKHTELDDATLNKLPPLPAGVPSSMWQLYPDVVSDMLANGPSQNSTGTSGGANPLTSSSLNPSNNSNVPTQGRGCWSCPVPQGIDPRVVLPYPPNLMQQVQMPITPPNLPQYPPAHFPPAPH